MSLVWILLLPFLGGLVVLISSRWSDIWPRWISLIAIAVHMVWLLALWSAYFQYIELDQGGPWLIQYSVPWIPQLGISFYLALDGLSLLLLLLTNFLSIVAVACSWNAIKHAVGFFHFNLLLILTALSGVFLSFDLFLFFVFWEISLVPLYFLIAIWGHENRIYATTKFFLITQGSGLLMLLAIFGLVTAHYRATGTLTFSYLELIGTPMSEELAWWLMLGFFIAFAVKLPAVPFHTWLPDAHTEAPTAGSVDLAGLVLKIGAYGMLRFVIPLFPQAASDFAPVAMTLGVVGILYAALVTLGQKDLKRFIAYTSVGHMGFVLLGIFAWNEIALQGAVLIMLAHGFSSGALFIMSGDLYERMHTRELDRQGGLWAMMPRMGGVGMFFTMALLGLPGLGSFIGEFLVLLGTFQVSVPLAVLASLGLVSATVYSLWMMQKVYHGPNEHDWQLSDTTGREMAIMVPLIAATLWLGVYPEPVFVTARHALQEMQKYAKAGRQLVRTHRLKEAEAPHLAASSNSGGKLP